MEKLLELGRKKITELMQKNPELINSVHEIKKTLVEEWERRNPGKNYEEAAEEYRKENPGKYFTDHVMKQFTIEIEPRIHNENEDNKKNYIRNLLEESDQKKKEKQDNKSYLFIFIIIIFIILYLIGKFAYN